jgi:hypothetical protein
MKSQSQSQGVAGCLFVGSERMGMDRVESERDRDSSCKKDQTSSP